MCCFANVVGVDPLCVVFMKCAEAFAQGRLFVFSLYLGERWHLAAFSLFLLSCSVISFFGKGLSREFLARKAASLSVFC